MAIAFSDDSLGPLAAMARSVAAGVFERIFAALAGEAAAPDWLMIDATHLKPHRTAASLLKKGLLRVASDAPKAG